MPLSKNYELGTLANTLDIDQSTGEITSLTIDTDIVSEGANLYFTSERVDDRVAALIQAGTNITVSYDDVLGTLTINASDTEDDFSNNTTSDLAEGTNLYYTNARADARIAAASIDALTDVDITTAAPSNGQSLVWDNANSKFIPGDSFSQSDFDTAFAAKSTTNLSEGTNLYYTNARADARIAAADTDDLSEGTTNLYFTNARADARIAAATTTDLTEGTNLYYTDARADARAQLKIDAIVDSAPNTLDTLNELAAALGDDDNFSTTITNSIATKLATADFNSTFDTRLGTKSTTNLTEGTNLYYTDARADARIAAADTDNLSEGSTNLYYTNARADARIALQAGANLDLSSKSTSDLTEGTNLYYTNARVDAHLNQSNPTSGYVLSWNGSDYAWIDNTGYTAFNTDFDTRLGTKTTANLTEGSNLYFTNTRADARVDAGFTAKSTSDLSEGTNLYYTNARADARIALQVGSNLDLSNKDTNSLSEGSNNLYYTNARVDARVNLQTGSNLNLSSKDTDDLSEGSNNLYFTNARVQGTAINAGSLRGSVNNATVQYGTSYSGTPAQGSFFFDSLNAKLKVYNGSAFVDAVPAGSGGGGGGGASDAVATFRKYTFDISSTTNSVSGKDSVVVTAGSFVTGYQYQIISVGNTDFTAIGASGNTVGVTFTATGVGSGTGTAGHILNYATSNQNVEVYRNGAKMVEGSSDDYVATTGTSVNFTYNLQSGDVVEVQVYELLTNDAYYLKTETYTQTQTNSQISTAVAGYLPLSGGVLTDDLAINNGSPELYFGTTGNHYNWRIAAQEAVDAAFEIAVGSQDTNYSNDTYTPKLVVKSSGSVGIGTTSPLGTLHLHSADTALRLTSSQGSNTPLAQLQYSGSGGYFLRLGDSSNNEDVMIRTYGNSHFNGGNVGIGTTNPGYPLQVNGSVDILNVKGSTGNAFVRFTDSDATADFSIGADDGSGAGAGAFILYDRSNSAYRLVVNSSGNVGIGTTSPSRLLEVRGSSNPAIRLNNTTDIADIGITSSAGALVTGSTSGALAIVRGGANDINFGTNGQNRVTINSSGNVGIGTTSPGRKLDVQGTGNVYGRFMSTNTTGAGINVKDSAEDWLIQADGSVGPGLAIYDLGRSAYRMLIKSNGNVGIGTSNPGAKLTLFGGSTTTQTFQSSWSSGTGRIAFIGGSSGVDGSGATSTAAKIESLATAPGGAATGDLKLIVNSGDSFVTGIEIVPDGAVRLALQGTHTTIGSYDDPRAPYGWNNITTNNHADVLWGLNSRLIGSGTGHDFEVVQSHGSMNSAGIMLTGNGNPESPSNILFFANGGSGTAGTVVASTDAKFKMNSGGSFIAENGSSGAVIRLDNIGNSGTSNHYIELSSNLPGYANGKYNCLKTNFGDLHFAVGGAYTGYISTNSGFVDVSDQSLKENVVTIDGALDKVEQLQGRYFTWISEDQSDDRQIGFIAQEVEAVVPELVTTSDTGIKGMSYGKATALLVEAIKEQQATIQALQDRLDAAGIE